MVDLRIKVDWTMELRASVLKRWDAGETATEIAATIPDATRSGILGLVHRSGRKRSDANVCRKAAAKAARPKPVPVPKPAPPPKAMTVTPSRLPATGWHNAGTPVPGHIPPEPPAPEPLRLTLMELHSRSCRWPVTDAAPWRYCGHRVDGENSATTPYCSHHAQARRAKDNPKKARSVGQLTRDLRQYL